MGRRRLGCALARRYGRSGRKEAGARPIDELLENQRRLTVRAPPRTMREVVEEDRRDRELEERPRYGHSLAQNISFAEHYMHEHGPVIGGALGALAGAIAGGGPGGAVGTIVGGVAGGAAGVALKRRRGA